MSVTNFPNGVSSFGQVLLGGGLPPNAHPVGVLYVDNSHPNAGTAAGKGRRPDDPFSTINSAYNEISSTASTVDPSLDKNIVILVMPDHDETVTAEITMDRAGSIIWGLRGPGGKYPSITNNFAGDTVAMDSADTMIANIRFVTPSNATGIAIDVNARAVVQGCRFECGANVTSVITVTATGDDSQILGNLFLVTANGPNEAIAIEGAADNLVIRGNIFNGGSTTNVWDDAAIDFAANTPINCLIEDNSFVYGTATVGTGNVFKLASANRFYRLAIPKAGVPRTFYADASASTTGSGDAEDPTTLTAAVDLAVAGDTVLLYPGTHTVTAAVAADVADLTIQPVNYVPGQRRTDVEIANDTDDVNTFDVTAADVMIAGIKFTKGINNTTDGTELIDVDSGGDFLIIRDCTFDMEARTNADCINIATGTKGHLIENCLFTDLATVKTAIAWASSAMTVRGCDFDFSAGDAVFSEQIATPGDGNFFYDNRVVSDDTATAVASWQTAPGEQFMARNFFASVAAGNVLGDDADLDPFVFDNLRETATTPIGAGEAINPSVS